MLLISRKYQSIINGIIGTNVYTFEFGSTLQKILDLLTFLPLCLRCGCCHCGWRETFVVAVVVDIGHHLGDEAVGSPVHT